MTFDLERIIEGKRLHRERIAALSIVDRLRMLDALREREIAIRRNSWRPTTCHAQVHETLRSLPAKP